MRQINIVAPDFICQYWNKIEPFFESSFKFSTDDYSVEQIKFLLVSGKQTCLVAVDENKEIIGASAVEISNYPNHRVLHITSMGGRALIEPDLIQQFESWARSQGVTKIRAFAHEAQARLYRMKMGFESVAQVVEKNI
jgi:hypothetical protein